MSIHLARNRRLVARCFDADNLRRRLDSASAQEWRDGLAWYPAAHDICQSVAATHGTTVETAAGILAALSPQTEWSLNLRMAETFIETGGAPSGHFDNADRKARAILGGAAPLDVLGGPKVRSFYRNILRPECPGAVTVDRHACAVLYGTTTPTYLRTYPKLLDRKGVYRLATGLYRTIAREYDLLPHEAQAIAWVAHRNAQDLGTF